MPQLEELWIEHNAAGVLLEHRKKLPQRVSHVVVVPEYFLAVAGPNVFPNSRWVSADAIYQPLGVIVQCDLRRQYLSQ